MKATDFLPVLIGSIGLVAGLSLGKGDRQSEPESIVVPPPAPITPPEITSTKLVWLETLAKAQASDLPALYKAAADDPDRLNMVAHFWTRTDPHGFLTHLLADDPPFFSEPAHAVHLFTEWGRRDFPAAIDAARSVPAFNPQRERILKFVIRSGMQSDPEAAVAAMPSIRGTSGSGAWYAPDAETAKAAIPQLAKLPMAGTLEMTLSRSLELWSELEPRAALDWTFEFAEQKGQNYHGLRSSVLSEVARADPEVALKALARLPTEGDRAKAVRTIAKNIARKMPEKAIEMIEEHGNGYYLYESAGHTAEELAEGKNPELGTNFALKFNDPDARRHAIERSVARYFSRDREALAAWAAGIENPTHREEVATAIAKLEEREKKKK